MGPNNFGLNGFELCGYFDEGVRMSVLTVFLARVIELLNIIIVIAFFVRGSAMIEATVADGSVMSAYAIISLAIGLAMIVGHPTNLGRGRNGPDSHSHPQPESRTRFLRVVRVRRKKEFF